MHLNLEVEKTATGVIIHAPHDEEYSFVRIGDDVRLTSSPIHPQKSRSDMEHIRRAARAALLN